MSVASAWQLTQQNPKVLRRIFNVTVEKTLRELQGESCYALAECPEAKKMITCSRSFSHRVTELPELRAAIASYVSRAGEKLRAQGDLTCALRVFIRTGQFNDNERQYSNVATVPLLTASSDTRDLISAAIKGLERIYRPGFRYLKAGVILMDLVPPRMAQADLFAAPPRPGSERLRSHQLTVRPRCDSHSKSAPHTELVDETGVEVSELCQSLV